jgi:HEAT repeat protein
MKMHDIFNEYKADNSAALVKLNEWFDSIGLNNIEQIYTRKIQAKINFPCDYTLVEKLIDVLSNHTYDILVRKEALYALIRYVNYFDKPFLVNMLLKQLDRELNISSVAASALGKIATNQICGEVEILLAKNIFPSNLHAVYLVGELNCISLYSRVKEYITHKNSSVRAIAIQVISKIGTQHEKSLLISMLQDEDIEVRISAVNSLAIFGYPAVKQVFLDQFLKETNPLVKLYIINILGEISEPESDIISFLETVSSTSNIYANYQSLDEAANEAIQLIKKRI